jgi:GxxExxY protein
VEATIIVELKAIEELAAIHEVQLVNYLVATGKPVGLLINFGPSGVVVRRKVRSLSPISC